MGLLCCYYTRSIALEISTQHFSTRAKLPATSCLSADMLYYCTEMRLCKSFALDSVKMSCVRVRYHDTSVSEIIAPWINCFATTFARTLVFLHRQEVAKCRQNSQSTVDINKRQSVEYCMACMACNTKPWNDVL